MALDQVTIKAIHSFCNELKLSNADEWPVGIFCNLNKAFDFISPVIYYKNYLSII